MSKLAQLVPRAMVYAAFAMARIGLPAVLHAQSPSRLDLGGVAEVGEAERYLRLLQLTDNAALVAWTSQPLSPARATANNILGAHPWSSRFSPSDSSARWRWLRPSARLVLNSAYPVEDAIGPVWAGKGVTGALQWGVMTSWRAFTLQFAPVAFLSQNAAFPLAPNGNTGIGQFRDARFPFAIDLPQRFGDGRYSRLDAGTSTLSVDLPFVSVGVTTAPQRWGPSLEYPLLLGPTAGGFPSYYVSTAHPVDVRIARIQARLIGGLLTQSAFSPAKVGESRRTVTGAAVSVMPSGLDGLELGVARMFETLVPLTLNSAITPVTVRKTAGADRTDNSPGENQTASAFFRWAFPAASVEFYGEWFRDDYSGSLRRFTLIPDDLSAFTLGFQRVLARSGTLRRVVRFEMTNGELSHQARLNRPPATAPLPVYLHSEVVQGHTLNGLLLGSTEAYGGEGLRLALDSYDERGRRTIAFERALRGDWLPTLPPTMHPDVTYALRWEMLRFVGARDMGIAVVPTIDLNRNLEAGANRFNLHVVLSERGW
jgi:hypothetical protein